MYSGAEHPFLGTLVLQPNSRFHASQATGACSLLCALGTGSQTSLSHFSVTSRSMQHVTRRATGVRHGN